MSWLQIHRYGPCIGITLIRFMRRQVELWYAPAPYATPEHSHEHSDGEFTILYSKNREIYRKVRQPDGTVRTDSYVANTPQCWGRFLSVRAGTLHAFERGDSCMIWLCFETWKRGVPMTSVADDFKLV